MTIEEFRALCGRVRHQITPTGCPRLDRETVYFAVCWTLCDLTERRLSLPHGEAVAVDWFRETIGELSGAVGLPAAACQSAVEAEISRLALVSGDHREKYAGVATWRSFLPFRVRLDESSLN